MPASKTRSKRASTSRNVGRGRTRSHTGSAKGRGRTQRTQRTQRTARGQQRSATRGQRRHLRRDLSNVQVEVEGAKELILQALETELGGVKIYETAVECAVNQDLKEEWQEYLDQTRHHVEVVQQLCQQVGLDPEEQTPNRRVVKALGESLVQAMATALQENRERDGAELVAAECVTLAETKDHLNWSLLSELAKADFEWTDAIQSAVDEVEDEEDEHLYHTMGWTRELWIECLGLPAALPPPEEEQDVKSMAGAARAKAQRTKFAKASR